MSCAVIRFGLCVTFPPMPTSQCPLTLPLPKENSWQLCTLVQEYLAASSNSQFVFGSPLYFGLTHNIRTRIYNRIYHVPQGSTVSLVSRYHSITKPLNRSCIVRKIAQLLQCITLLNDSYWKETFLPKAVVSSLRRCHQDPSNAANHPQGIGKKYDTLFHSHQNVPVPDAQVIDVCETLRVLSGHATDVAEGCLLASRASALYRQLTLKDPDRHRERFIASLNTHADRLLACKRPEDACDVLRQVVQQYMLSYEESPRSSITKLANSVRSYAKQVARAGPLTRDCNPLQDLLNTYQELYKRDPDKWYKELDETLSVCIEQILRAGRVRDALSSSSLIMGLYRVRYAADPRKHWLPFVTALQGYIERLFKTRRATDAVDNAHDLMRTYRTLWRTYPGIHRLALAQSLEAYSQRLFRVRRPTEACSALSEIVDMYRVQYAKSPETHHSSLAESLFGYADGLINAGRVVEACAATQEVVDVYYKLCRKNPETYHAHLGHALDAHADRLNIAGRDAKAWARRVEIVDFYRDLDREEPGSYHREIAASLNSCADHLTRQGRASEACDAAIEIVEYYRAVSGSSTEKKAAGFAELSQALTSYADRLERAEKFDHSCAVMLEIVELNRVLYNRHPYANAWDMADALDAYAARLVVAGRIEEACKISLEAVGIDREHRTHRLNDPEPRKRGCFERVFSCCQYLAHMSRYLEVLDMAGDALEGLKSQRAFYAVGEQLPPEQEWLDVVESKFRSFVQDILAACTRHRISIPSRSVLGTSPPSTSVQRSRRSSTTKRPRLGWEIHRWRAQKAAEGRRPG